MKTWKLVSGILSIAFAAFMLLQSAASALYEIFAGNGYSGVAGLLSAIFILTAGIVSIVMRKDGKVGNIACITLYCLAAIIGFLFKDGVYSDLIFWSIWAAVCAFVLIVSFSPFVQAKNIIMRSLCTPIFLSGCFSSMLLGAVFGSLIPFIVYCIGYVVIIFAQPRKTDKHASKSATQGGETDPADDCIEKIVYTCIIVAGVIVLAIIALLVVYRSFVPI